jgi:hypothetical protein
MTEVHGGSEHGPEAVKALLKQAEQGDTTVLPALRTYMDQSPSVWEQGGDIAKATQRALLDQAAGKNLVIRETLARKCAALTQELAGPTPSPLERLLVERIVLCWLHLHCAEATYLTLQDLSLRQAALHQARISKAQARYLAAIRTLAQVRRLEVPAV